MLYYRNLCGTCNKTFGASGRNRTIDTRIFSPLLYRLSYGTIMAVWTGLEPATSAVTGRHSNQLNYQTNNNKNGGDRGI